jgi:hypothetical protein
LKIEQTGVNKAKITLETTLERDTFGSTGKLEIVVETSREIGYREGTTSRTVEVDKIDG